MEETALLTDDEIVALCAADGRPWPIGLTTVQPTAEELARAGARGMRSLMVRRLAGGDADKPGVRPHQMIASDIAAFLDATDRVGAYIAPASDHSVLGGAAVTAARTPDGWVVDTTTAAGVHALRATSADEAAAAVLELAGKAFSGELFNDDTEAATWVCVIRYGSDNQNVLSIGPGSVTGNIDGAALDALGPWDATMIRRAFD